MTNKENPPGTPRTREICLYDSQLSRWRSECLCLDCWFISVLLLSVRLMLHGPLPFVPGFSQKRNWGMLWACCSPPAVWPAPPPSAAECPGAGRIQSHRSNADYKDTGIWTAEVQWHTSTGSFEMCYGLLNTQRIICLRHTNPLHCPCSLHPWTSPEVFLFSSCLAASSSASVLCTCWNRVSLWLWAVPLTRTHFLKRTAVFVDGGPAFLLSCLTEQVCLVVHVVKRKPWIRLFTQSRKERKGKTCAARVCGLQGFPDAALGSSLETQVICPCNRNRTYMTGNEEKPVWPV